MSAQLPFQVHISLNVYGTSPEHVQQALKEACDELLQGSTESNAVRADQKAGFTFKPNECRGTRLISRLIKSAICFSHTTSNSRASNASQASQIESKAASHCQRVASR